MSHFLLLTTYALLLSVFFAVLWRRERKEQGKLFFQLFGSLVGGALALACLMYAFPSGPPAPIP
jgi:hypothetical protein